MQKRGQNLQASTERVRFFAPPSRHQISLTFAILLSSPVFDLVPPLPLFEDLMVAIHEASADNGDNSLTVVWSSGPLICIYWFWADYTRVYAYVTHYEWSDEEFVIDVVVEKCPISSISGCLGPTSPFPLPLLSFLFACGSFGVSMR